MPTRQKAARERCHPPPPRQRRRGTLSHLAWPLFATFCAVWRAWLGHSHRV